jgi:hypothetical protein
VVHGIEGREAVEGGVDAVGGPHLVGRPLVAALGAAADDLARQGA